MKIRLALATVAFSVLTAVAAHAQVNVSLSPLTPPSTSDFTGILTTSSAVTITEDSFGWQPSTALMTKNTLEDDIFTMGGVSLVPGTPYNFSFSFDSPVSVVDLAVKNGQGIIVGQGSTVPEPGSIAMLIGTTMGGGLLIARRRRK